MKVLSFMRRAWVFSDLFLVTCESQPGVAGVMRSERWKQKT